MVVNIGSNDNLQIYYLRHGNMLSSSSKRQRNVKVSLNNGILRVGYKMTINMLMKEYTLLYNTFISLVDSTLGTLVELSTNQPK